MGRNWFLRSHALLSLSVAAAAVFLITRPSTNGPEYNVTAFTAPFIIAGAITLILMVCAREVVNRETSFMSNDAALLSYYAALVSSGIAIAAIPAWILGATVASILVCLFSLVFVGIASLLLYGSYEVSGAGRKRFVMGLIAISVLTPAIATVSTAYIGSGGGIPTLESRVTDAIAPFFMLVMFLAQFTIAWTLERPLKTDESQKGLHVVSRNAA